LTAMFSVHLRYGYSSIRLKSVSAAGPVFGPIGYELNLLYIAGLVTLAISGPSAVSVDRWLERRRKT
jgi:putative oxidoreductase